VPSSLSGSPALPRDEQGDIAATLRRLIRDVPDYPQPGVLFKDITPLLADAAGFAATIDALAASDEAVDKVVGIEARGFILAAPVACRLGVGFVPVRKKGKLPGPTYAETYELEYGTATVEVHVDAGALRVIDKDDSEKNRAEVQKVVLGANDVPLDAHGAALPGGKPPPGFRLSTELSENELFGGQTANDPLPWWLEGGRKIPNVSGYDVPEYAVFADRVRRLIHANAPR